MYIGEGLGKNDLNRAKPPVRQPLSSVYTVCNSKSRWIYGVYLLNGTARVHEKKQRKWGKRVTWSSNQSSNFVYPTSPREMQKGRLLGVGDQEPGPLNHETTSWDCFFSRSFSGGMPIRIQKNTDTSVGAYFWPKQSYRHWI